MLGERLLLIVCGGGGRGGPDGVAVVALEELDVGLACHALQRPDLHLFCRPPRAPRGRPGLAIGGPAARLAPAARPQASVLPGGRLGPLGLRRGGGGAGGRAMVAAGGRVLLVQLGALGGCGGRRGTLGPRRRRRLLHVDGVLRVLYDLLQQPPLLVLGACGERGWWEKVQGGCRGWGRGSARPWCHAPQPPGWRAKYPSPNTEISAPRCHLPPQNNSGCLKLRFYRCELILCFSPSGQDKLPSEGSEAAFFHCLPEPVSRRDSLWWWMSALHCPAGRSRPAAPAESRTSESLQPSFLWFGATQKDYPGP